MPASSIDDQIQELLQMAIDTCEDRQAQDLTVYDMRGKSTLADYYLFCTGNSTTHIQALSGNLERRLKEGGFPPRSIEGTPDSRWMLLDYNHILVHIFDAEARARYNVEALLERDRRIYPVDSAEES